MNEVVVPVVAGVLALLAGIPVARWLEQTTYRKPDEVEEPYPGRRWWVPPTLGVLVGLLVHRIWFVDDPAVHGPWVAGVLTATLLVVALANVCLAAMDFDVHRLPDRIMWPTMATLGGGYLLAAIVGGGLEPLLRALLAGLGAGGFYLLIALVSLARGSLAVGLGDVKLAAVLGGALGWFGWPEVLVGIYAGFLVGGFFGVLLLLGRRVSWKGHFAYGPPMMIGAMLGLVLGAGLLPGWG